MKKYPIGTTWQAEDDRGRIGRITLHSREYIGHHCYEVWHWSVRWDDGSGYEFDTCSSYRTCREEIPIWNKDYSAPRFKIVPK